MSQSSDGSFASLTADGLDAYIAHHQAHDGLWIFQHIPKTAGSSLANEIARNRKPYRNINVAKQPVHLPHEARLDAAAGMFLSDNRERPFRSASGHIRRWHIDRIRAEVPDVRVCTFLREPVARIVSDYRYARTPAHPNWRKVIEQVPDFEAYLEHPSTHNKMAWFLFGRADLPVDEAVESAFRHLSFIGVQDHYALSFTLLSTLLWEPQAPALRKRITQATTENEVKITDALRDRITEMNRLDVALFEAASARIASLAGRVAIPAPRPEGRDQAANARSGAM